jgi:hypothetical protein
MIIRRPRIIKMQAAADMHTHYCLPSLSILFLFLLFYSIIQVSLAVEFCSSEQPQLLLFKKKKNSIKIYYKSPHQLCV